MSTRPTKPTHEADVAQPLPPDDPRGSVESPSADRAQGASGLPHDLSRRNSEDAERAKADPDADDGPSSDQDIDTAGTDADPDSPTRAIGTGIARDRSRG